MYSTGDADRAPVRCTEPTAYAHTGPEAAFAALTGVASGRPQRVDVSMQEVVLVASMGAAGRFARTGFRGRRSGSAVGPHPRDLAVRRRLRVVRAPRRQGAGAEPPAHHPPAGGGRAGRPRPQRARLDDVQPQHRHRRRAARHRGAHRALLRRRAPWPSSTRSRATPTSCSRPPTRRASSTRASSSPARGFFGPYGDVARFPLSFVQVRGAAPARPRPHAVPVRVALSHPHGG